MRQGWTAIVVAGFALASTAARAETGRAVIQATADGSQVTGSAILTDTSDGLTVSIQVANIPPGKHGLHIHQYGLCEDHGNAVGGHFNPDGVPHGLLLTDGFAHAHAGDLGDIEIGPDGTGSLSLVLPGLTVSGGKYGVAGRAIILHEKVDDFGQPTGNAGGRIGCGSILIVKG